MQNYILTQTAMILCPHGGIVTFISTGISTYRVNGEIPMTLSDQYMIAGCPFHLPMGGTSVPNPCIRVQWIIGSHFLYVRGMPALTNASIGMCQSAMGIPGGAPIIASFQTIEMEPRTVTRVD